MEANYPKVLIMLEDIESAAKIARELGLRDVAVALFGIGAIVTIGKDNPEKGAALLTKTGDYFRSISKEVLDGVK